MRLPHPRTTLLDPSPLFCPCVCAESVLEAFLRLHDDGLVYRGAYLVNWSPGLQTAVSDLEVEYSEEPGSLFYFKYPVEGEGKG